MEASMAFVEGIESTISAEDLQHYTAILMHNLFFRELTPEESQKLIQASSVVHIEAGRFLITQGEIGNSMYAILEGSFVVLIQGQGSEIHEVAELAPPEIIGEIAC